MRKVTEWVMSREPDREASGDPGAQHERAGSRLVWLGDVVATRNPVAFDEFVRVVAEVARAVTMDPPRAPSCRRCGARVDSGAQIAGALRPLWDAPRPEIARAFYGDPLGRWFLHERLVDAASRLDGYCTAKCAGACERDEGSRSSGDLIARR